MTVHCRHCGPLIPKGYHIFMGKINDLCLTDDTISWLFFQDNHVVLKVAMTKIKILMEMISWLYKD